MGGHASPGHTWSGTRCQPAPHLVLVSFQELNHSGNNSNLSTYTSSLAYVAFGEARWIGAISVISVSWIIFRTVNRLPFDRVMIESHGSQGRARGNAMLGFVPFVAGEKRSELALSPAFSFINGRFWCGERVCVRVWYICISFSCRT